MQIGISLTSSESSCKARSVGCAKEVRAQATGAGHVGEVPTLKHDNTRETPNRPAKRVNNFIRCGAYQRHPTFEPANTTLFKQIAHEVACWQPQLTWATCGNGHCDDQAWHRNDRRVRLF